MAEFINIAIYLLLSYASINLLKLMGLDLRAFLSPKIDHNIYIINDIKEEQTELAPVTKVDPEESTLRYNMNYNDKYLKNILKNKPIKKKEYIDNIFDLI